MNDEWSHKYGLWLYVMHMLTFLLIISSGTTSWYRMVCSSIDRSIDAMKSVTLTMLSQFFNLAWKVNADEQCCLPASTFFFVYHFCLLCCAAAVACFQPFYFCFFRLRVEVLSDHSLFLLHPPIRVVMRGDRFCLSLWMFQGTNLYTQFITVIVNKFIYYTCDTLFVCTLYYTLYESISTHKVFKEFIYEHRCEHFENEWK